MGSRSFWWKKRRTPSPSGCKNMEKSVSASCRSCKSRGKPCKTRLDSVHVCTCSRTHTHTHIHGYVHEHMEKLNTTGGTRGSRVLRVITDPGWITRSPVILLTVPIRAPKFLHIRYERWTPRAEYVSWILTGLNYGRLIIRAVIEAFATKRVAWSSHRVWP